MAFSDVHCDLDACARLVAAAAEADLVIGAGDFARRHEGLSATMRALAPLARKAIYVPGNNETAAALRQSTAARVLHGEGAEFGAITVVGLGGGVPPLPDAPFASFDQTEAEAAAALAEFGSADILVLHSPPKGVADVFGPQGSIGSAAIRDAIFRMQPGLALCGHVHDCWGQSGRIGTTPVHNLGPTVNWFEI
jgi:Icc-related predicted phosphoesterase